VKLRELAARLQCVLDGDGEIDIERVAAIHDAGPGDVTFLANRKYEKALPATRASAVILHTDGPAAPCATLRSPSPTSRSRGPSVCSRPTIGLPPACTR
jgi:UDP-3-O-[3-hydroxymyristoyl] glucosamine N-acyltransferase